MRLLGENGAGKSTLIKLMAGFYSPDRGEIRVGGDLLPPDPAAAHRAGVATIHQDAHLIPSMTVAENIMLGRWPRRYGLISVKQQRARAAEALARVAPHLSPTDLARRLSPADGQLVEIARAISEDSRVLIMDEPTTSLSRPEIDRLFKVVDDLKAKGLGIVFVSHWLDEVFRVADRITVLRDGRFVGSRPAAELDHDKVIRMMVGREVRETVAQARPIGDVVLEVRNLNRAGVLKDVSLTVRAGEIVGLSGLVGAGRSELASCIFGIDPYDSGSVTVGGVAVPPNQPKAAIDAGIGLVPEDRRKQALVTLLSVGTNITLGVLDQISPRGILSSVKEQIIVDREIKALAIKTSSANARRLDAVRRQPAEGRARPLARTQAEAADPRRAHQGRRCRRQGGDQRTRDPARAGRHGDLADQLRTAGDSGAQRPGAGDALGPPRRGYLPRRPEQRNDHGSGDDRVKTAAA